MTDSPDSRGRAASRKGSRKVAPRSGSRNAVPRKSVRPAPQAEPRHQDLPPKTAPKTAGRASVQKRAAATPAQKGTSAATSGVQARSKTTTTTTGTTQPRSKTVTATGTTQARSKTVTTTGTTQPRSKTTTTTGTTQAPSKAATTSGTTQARSKAVTTSGTTQVVDAQTFKVDLEDLASSIALVQSRATSIGDEYNKIKSLFGLLPDAWSSPAADTFTPLETQLLYAMSTLQLLLAQIVIRMRQTYDNYVQAETANVQILTP
jgi:uncharacterized protein YukE